MNTTDLVMASMEANAVKTAPGRPVVAGSARQIKLAAMQARAEANGGAVRLGRPAVEGSKRQQQIEEKAAKIASGYIPKRGRPSFESLGLEKKAPTKTQSKSITQLALERAQAMVNVTVEPQADETPVEAVVEPKKSKKKAALEL